MIQLLYSVILTEMVLILMLLFKTPLRKLVIMALDRVKRGRGFTLFLAFMIDRLHHYIRELRQLRNTMEATKKQTRGLDDSKSNPEELKALGEEVANLRSKVKKMEAECEAKTKEAKAAAEKADAVKTQSQGFIQEYERLQEDNQNLRSQIESIESEGKKDM
ncbi:hypothetical protein LINPERPRIM_LOCUS1822 [Linum perenne]